FAGYIGWAYDDTDRKTAGDELRALDVLFRQFVESVPAAVAMFDKNMRYLIASKRWLKDYHLDDRNIIGLTHYEVFPDVPERWKEIHQRALAGSVECCEEDHFVRADGTVELIRWELQPWRDT
ncbi:MAG: PAS domain-containing protein, partial [Chloroflexi bacterium]|nr:PAS domain-containing protein [Chloroflexota bacterium]